MGHGTRPLSECGNDVSSEGSVSSSLFLLGITRMNGAAYAVIVAPVEESCYAGNDGGTLDPGCKALM